MAVGVLLVTHIGIGTALLAVAGKLLPNLPLAAEAFEVAFDADPDAMLPAASAALLRVMNYAELGLDELPAVAAAGARNGVVRDDA